MKSLAIILSFYMLCLTVFPCIDMAKESIKDKSELTEQSSNSHHHSDADHCSPFCTCNCCATSVIFPEYTVHLTCFSFFEKQYFPASNNFFADPLASIWQPPKIA